MKILLKVFPVLLLSFAFFGFAPSANALSSSWSTTVNATFKYLWSYGAASETDVCTIYFGVPKYCVDDPYRWAHALQNPNITITYGGDVYNRDTGSVITPGSIVGVGTRLEFRPKAFEDTDIYWFGTGFSSDSPYGHWQTGAIFPPESDVLYTGPTYSSLEQYWADQYPGPGQTESAQEKEESQCLDQDYVATVNTGVSTVEVYIPLSVTAPTVTVTHGGTAVLSCDGTNRLCTVTSAGTINSSFVFGATTGKFYYRYNDNRFGGSNIAWFFDGFSESSFALNNPYCTGNTIALRTLTGGTAYSYTWGTNLPAVGSSAYTLSVPQRTIAFAATAAVTNQPPAVPTISGPTTGVTNTSYTFTFTAIDPNSDTVRYGIDWDNNGTVNQWIPSSGYVASGQSQSTTRSWGSVGTYTFRALAQDSNGSSSGWRTHTITIGNATPQCADGIDNDGDGRIDLADYGCTGGTDTTESPNPQCSDGTNNDTDAWTDYPNDPGCISAADTTESPNPQCSDGIDNNGNGEIDYPADLTCSSLSDNNEEVAADASLSLTAPSLVQPNSAALLSWSAANVQTNSCTLTGTNGNSWNLTGTSGTRTSSALTGETTFTLSCTDLDSDVETVTATVRITPSFEEI